MEYTQMTLDDWLSLKKKLENDLNGVAASFVRIGYTLRKIEDEKLYERDGYSSVTEFAKNEYGLSSSTVSRFMAINRRYSIDGYSEKLRSEFAGIGSSKLSEMLALPDSDLSMIKPETPREAIRELKDFNKTEEEGTADRDRFLMEFLAGCSEEWIYTDLTTDKLKEALNPSGSRVYRKGKFFMAFYDYDVKIKKFGQDPETLTWDQLSAWIQQHLEEIKEVRKEEATEGPEEEAVAPAQKPAGYNNLLYPEGSEEEEEKQADNEKRTEKTDISEAEALPETTKEPETAADPDEQTQKPAGYNNLLYPEASEEDDNSEKIEEKVPENTGKHQEEAETTSNPAVAPAQKPVGYSNLLYPEGYREEGGKPSDNEEITDILELDSRLTAAICDKRWEGALKIMEEMMEAVKEKLRREAIEWTNRKEAIDWENRKEN